MIASGSYITELHDIHPGMIKYFKKLTDAIPNTALDKALLMIVPNWDNQFPLDLHPEFVNCLRSLPCEKVIHGYTHCSGHDWWNKFWFGTGNHAEFSTLSGTDIMNRLKSARGLFEKCFGKPSSWFCAPRWQQSKKAHNALMEAGFQGYMLRDRYVFSGKNISIPAIYFDNGNRCLVKAGAKVLRDHLIKATLAARKPFRLVLHPSDLNDDKLWRQVIEVIEFLEKNNWLPVSLQEAIAS